VTDTSRWQFRILGDLEVVREGEAVDLASPRHRMLLAVLLLHPNQTVGVDQILQALWGEDQPARALNAVQVYVSRLRKTLGADRLVTKRPGYMLVVEPGELDTQRFEALAREGSEAATRGAWAEAASRFRRALDLWRGPALSDFAYEDFAREHCVRLEEARLAAVEGCLDARLAQGEDAALVPELEQLVTSHPLRERFSAQLMLALYRCGRQAEALRAYQRLRRWLADELGIAPGPDVSGLEQAILEQRADLMHAAGPRSAPAHPGPGTVLLTDATGSLRLWDRQPEALRAALAVCGPIVRSTVEGQGGTVIHATGDAVLARFASPAEAALAGPAIQDAVRIAAQEPAQDLWLRIAITEESSVAPGTASAIAACSRLLQLAGDHDIVVSSVTAAALDGRLPSPLTLVVRPGSGTGAAPVHLLVRGDGGDVLRTPPSSRSLPVPLAQAAARDIYGREQELDRLRGSWRQVVDGEQRIVLVSGDAGIGKTRFAAAVAEEAAAEGLVLYGRCDEAAGLPFEPFVDALTAFVDRCPGMELEMMLGRHAGELSRLVPALQRRLPGLPEPLQSSPETERHRLFEAVAAWLSAVSIRQPVLLVLDDLHWADRPTLLLLAQLASVDEASRALILGTFRDSEMGPGHPLPDVLADLRREPCVERMGLEGLQVDAVVDMLGHVGGDENIRPDLAATIHAQTGGNPFFVVELLRHLRESGWHDDRAPEGAAELGIPAGVREVLRRRVGRLQAATRELLEVAAVIGMDSDVALLQAVTGLGDDELDAATVDALATRLLEQRPGRALGYRFAHALGRDALYDEIPAGRRARLHRQVGLALERSHHGHLGPVLPELAHHFHAAALDIDDVTKAVDYALRAGDQAFERVAPDLAVTLYGRSVALLDSHGMGGECEDRRELLIRLGEAQRAAGHPGYRATLLDAVEAARRYDDAPRLARAAVANSRGFWSASGEMDTERVRALEDALAAVGSEPTPLRTQLLATLAAELVFSAEQPRRFALSEEAVRDARASDDRRLLAHVLSMHPMTMWAPGRLDVRLAASAEGRALALELGDPEQLARIELWCCAVASMEAPDLEEVDRSLAAASALAEELQNPRLRWGAAVFGASRALIAGRLDDAEAQATAALGYGQDAGEPDAMVIFAGQLWFIRYEQGRLDELTDVVAAVVRDVPGLPAWKYMLAVSYCETGREDEAREAWADLKRNDFADLPDDATGLLSMTAASMIAAHLEDADAASRLRPHLEPHRSRVMTVGTGSLGIGAHFLGLVERTVGRLHDAEVLFEEAAEVHARLSAPGWVARTQLELARTRLRADPGCAVATVLLRAAETGAARLGQRAVAAGSRALLTAGR
jgi:DNA-binding SARP family transcriptional activator